MDGCRQELRHVNSGQRTTYDDTISKWGGCQPAFIRTHHYRVLAGTLGQCRQSASLALG